MLLILLVVEVLYWAFVFQFVSSSAIILTRKSAGCFTLIILYISVFCVPSLRCSGSVRSMDCDIS